MTATIELRHEHTDDINAAREKVRSFIDDLGRREGIKGTWDEHRCAIQGTGLSGTVQVSETDVAVVIDLALVMRPFASIVRNVVADGLTAAFGSIEIAETADTADTKDATPSPDETPLPGAAPVPEWVGALVRRYQVGYSLERHRVAVRHAEYIAYLRRLSRSLG